MEDDGRVRCYPETKEMRDSRGSISDMFMDLSTADKAMLIFLAENLPEHSNFDFRKVPELSVVQSDSKVPSNVRAAFLYLLVTVRYQKFWK